MKRFAAMLTAAALCALPALAAATDAEKTMPPQQGSGRVVAEFQSAENAKVKAIDPATRTLTLTMPDGTDHSFVVDKAVTKLNQVQVGDTVKIRYREALSVKLMKKRVAPQTKVEGMVQGDEQSMKPAGKSTMIVTTTATIDKIFANGTMVTLRLPDGTTTDVQVRDPQNRTKIRKGEVKPGDQIEITYLRALAVSVEKTSP